MTGAGFDFGTIVGMLSGEPEPEPLDLGSLDEGCPEGVRTEQCAVGVTAGTPCAMGVTCTSRKRPPCIPVCGAKVRPTLTSSRLVHSLVLHRGGNRRDRRIILSQVD